MVLESFSTPTLPFPSPCDRNSHFSLSLPRGRKLPRTETFHPSTQLAATDSARLSIRTSVRPSYQESPVRISRFRVEVEGVGRENTWPSDGAIGSSVRGEGSDNDNENTEGELMLSIAFS